MSERERLVPLFVKFIEQLYPKPESILDVGCGPLAKAFRKHYGKKYIGLDTINSDHHKHKIGDAHHMPSIKTESFDVVTLWSVLEHLRHPAMALEETFRITKHVLIVSTDLTQQDRDGDPTHLYCWTPKVLGQFLALAGGREVKTWTENSILFGMVRR